MAVSLMTAYDRIGCTWHAAGAMFRLTAWARAARGNPRAADKRHVRDTRAVSQPQVIQGGIEVSA
jgi:hypothetical protein